MDPQSLVEKYLAWLKQEITITDCGEFCGISVPLLDRFNDYLQIFVKEENGGLLITDGGYIISNLITSGIGLRKGSEKRNRIDSIIREHNLTLKDDAIWVCTTFEKFPVVKHSVLQAMLEIDDLYDVGRPANTVFANEVQSLFDSHQLYYTRDITLRGRTGGIYTYDFLFQRNERRNEDIYCKTINRLTETHRNLAIFNWTDSQLARSAKSRLLVLYNDEPKSAKRGQNIKAFQEYGITAFSIEDNDSWTSFVQTA